MKTWGQKCTLSSGHMLRPNQRTNCLDLPNELVSYVAEIIPFNLRQSLCSSLIDHQEPHGWSMLSAFVCGQCRKQQSLAVGLIGVATALTYLWRCACTPGRLDLGATEHGALCILPYPFRDAGSKQLAAIMYHISSPWYTHVKIREFPESTSAHLTSGWRCQSAARLGTNHHKSLLNLHYSPVTNHYEPVSNHCQPPTDHHSQIRRP